jgi:hypothetical protein
LEREAEVEGGELVPKFRRKKRAEAVRYAEVEREDPVLIRHKERAQILEQICDVLLRKGEIDVRVLKVKDLEEKCCMKFRRLLILHLLDMGKRRNDKKDVQYVLEMVGDAVIQRMLAMTRLEESALEEGAGDVLLSGEQLERIRDVAEDLYEDIGLPSRYRSRKNVLVGRLVEDLPLPADDVWARVKAEMVRIKKEKKQELDEAIWEM